MSGSTENSLSTGECERVLDYAYGELSGSDAAAFEKHLESCAKCAAELAVMRRVRSAVREAMPQVELPSVATSALHAQLLHAAAQRKPARAGKVLAFARKIVAHPGYAAAAGLLIVGGAVGLQWSRGKMMVPAPSMSAPVTASAEPAKVDLPKALDEEAPVAKPAAAGNEGEAADKNVARAKSDSPDLFVTEKSKPAAHASAAPKKPASPSAMRKDVRSTLDSSDSFAPVFDAKLGSGAASQNGSTGGSGGGNDRSATVYMGGVKGRAEKPAEATPPPMRPSPTPRPVVTSSSPPASPPPASPPPASMAESNVPPADRVQAQAPGYAQPPPAQNAQGATALQQNNLGKAEPAQSNAGPLADLRKKAAEAATSGHCDEALKIYRDLEAKSPNLLTGTDHAHYSRCIMQNSRQQQQNNVAEELDGLRNNKNSFDDNNAAPAPRRASKVKKAKSIRSGAGADDAAPTETRKAFLK